MFLNVDMKKLFILNNNLSMNPANGSEWDFINWFVIHYGNSATQSKSFTAVTINSEIKIRQILLLAFNIEVLVLCVI